MKIYEIRDTLQGVDGSLLIYFDFGGFYPSRGDSWRGSYNEPSIGYTKEESCTVEDFLLELRQLTKETYTGYKGGEYTYSDNDTLHVDNYGEFTETEITSITVKSYCVIINTAHIDY